MGIRVKNKISLSTHAVDGGPSPEANPRGASLMWLRERKQSFLLNRVDIGLLLVICYGQKLGVVTKRYVLDRLISFI